VKKVTAGHSFPASFGFSGSTGKLSIKPHLRSRPAAPPAQSVGATLPGMSGAAGLSKFGTKAGMSVASPLTSKPPRQNTKQSPATAVLPQPFQDFKRGGAVRPSAWHDFKRGGKVEEEIKYMRKGHAPERVIAAERREHGMKRGGAAKGKC
jgi:hypothetical protein